MCEIRQPPVYLVTTPVESAQMQLQTDHVDDLELELNALWVIHIVEC